MHWIGGRAEATGVTAGTGPSADYRESDRDRVDFTAVTTWLRRRGLLAPPRPPRPLRPPILVPGGQQVPAGASSYGPVRPATTLERFLGTRGTDPGVGGFAWQRWDWTPDAHARPVTKDNLARLIVVAATVAYIWLFAYWTMRNHDGYGTQAFDFGIYDQGMWLMSRFKRPFITVMGRHLFGDHTSFILLPLVPIYWILPSAKVLLFAQAAALGGAAVPAFLLGREKLRSERLAALHRRRLPAPPGGGLHQPRAVPPRRLRAHPHPVRGCGSWSAGDGWASSSAWPWSCW